MTFSEKIEKLIIESIRLCNTCPSIRSIANEIGLSERTLRRKLCREGTNLRILTQRARLSVLAELPHDSLENLAEALGYAEARSVRRLVGRHLTELRNIHHSG